MRTGTVVGALVLLLAGCSGGDEPSSAASPGPIATAAVPTPGASAPDVEPAPNVGTPSERPDEVQEAVRLMAEELGRPADQIRVVRVEDLIWPDSALGCPVGASGSPTVGPVHGYRIILAHEAVELHYHGADGTAPRRCDFLDF